MRRPRWIPSLSPTELLLLGGLVVAGGLLWAFIEIAEEVTEGDTKAIDEAILLWFREPGNSADPIGPSWVTEAVRDITALGSFPVLGLVVIATLGFLLLTKERVIALLLAISVVGGTIVSSVLKEVFSRPRPTIEHAAEVFTASFPSGHALTSAVTYLTLGALVARTQELPAVRGYIIALAVLVTLMIGISRLYLGVHFPTDVLAGWCLGATWAGLCLIVAAWLQQRTGRP